MGRLRFFLQTLLSLSALVGLLLFLYGNAVLLKVGVLNAPLANLIEALRWGWLALALSAGTLAVALRPPGGMAWAVPLAALLAVIGVLGWGSQWFPARYTDAPTPPALVPSQTLAESDWVLGVSLNGLARAYPWDLIRKDYVVNDTLGGVSLVVMYCISCNSSLAYRAEHEGKSLSFGVLGVYHQETLLHDSASGSWWRENGAAIAGPLSGIQLEQLPAALMAWADWRALYPDTQLALK